MSSAIPQPVLEMSIESVSAGLQFADTSLMEYAGNMVAMLFYRADFDDETCEWIESLGKEADTFEMLGCKVN
jgi:alkyl hydroperoxide reductase subunit AhpC